MLLERIRDAMHFRRVSKSGLAILLGVRQATVTQWFTKERLPDTVVFLSLQRVLGGDGNWWYGMPGGVAPPREAVTPPPAKERAQARQSIEVVNAVESAQADQPAAAGRKQSTRGRRQAKRPKRAQGGRGEGG